ncbi:hypothetical protein C9F11_10190 [Streptomyces sp. YIM 121038]|uniref:glycerophosphodiester phosphodiesterase n=1 Tax=Streptomyces sp. YIM 121038 TaxID=2136401 RepID=UPI0011100EC4|nr:glycerophosphodiester phosphodiesterase [Streptomyces sp. YIM 121038]QCX75718.1 hypothetical protein C9F11_10190 [Streptomyces sp. YIM 121038]
MRHLYGGTAADVAEDASGVRVPGATGTVWTGPGEGATQITDLLALDGAPMQQLVADSAGMLPAFYGPESKTRVWVDFGGARVALVATDTADRLSEHQAAADPHGSTTAAVEAIQARMGRPLGFAQLDENGRVPASQLPLCPCQTKPPQTAAE